MNLNSEQTKSLKRVLDFVVTFHDELPENSPELTADVVALLEGIGSEDFAFAEGLLNQIQAPDAAA